MRKKKIVIVNKDTGEVIENAAIVKPKYSNLDFFMKLYLSGAVEISKMRLRGETMRVLFYLLGNCSYGNIINIPQKEIAEALEIKRPSVSAAIKELLDNNILLPGEKNGRCNTYRLNHALGSKGTASLEPGKFKLLGSQKPKKKSNPSILIS